MTHDFVLGNNYFFSRVYLYLLPTERSKKKQSGIVKNSQSKTFHTWFWIPQSCWELRPLDLGGNLQLYSDYVTCLSFYSLICMNHMEGREEQSSFTQTKAWMQIPAPHTWLSDFRQVTKFFQSLCHLKSEVNNTPSQRSHGNGTK